MAGKKKTAKQTASESRVGEFADQLEHAFLAGIGALSDAQKKGAKRFDSLVREGEKFRFQLPPAKEMAKIAAVTGTFSVVSGVLIGALNKRLPPKI